MTCERAMPGGAEWADLAAPHLARYLMAAEFTTGRRVLDAGSGAGYGATILRYGGAAVVLGIDKDAGAVATARDKFTAPNLSFALDDCEKLERVDEGWEVICCFEVIEHLRHPETFLARAGRLLATGGVLLVSTPDRASTPAFVDGRPRNRFHEHEWFTADFVAMLGRHFHEVELRVQVETAALQARTAAVAAVREGLTACNPVAAFAWRKWPFRCKADRGWTRLQGLAAPGLADFPIVPAALATVYGTPRFNVGICRRPVSGDSP
ncbi:MAG: class I SAM-dependent methyltransferase [Planctomycetaceae bacterium]|jgi:SAM-dependent methyltransferase|nr:class I SAM-dependent methyltransferase [Planctomycetaceae bacterium]